MSGVVVDDQGQPIADVSIDHLADRARGATGPAGTFGFATSAPRVVFRKTGFQPVLVKVLNETSSRVVMSHVAKGLPACFGREKCSYMSDSTFCIPELAGVRAPVGGHDFDYQLRSFRLTSGEASVTHGAGPMWSFGLPSDKLVWSSEKYSETDYEYQGIRIIDARGKDSKGNAWRFLGIFGETLEYRDASEPDALKLDPLSCLKPR